MTIKNWGKDLFNSGEIEIEEKEGETKNKNKVEKKDSSHNVFSEYYIPPIVISSNIIGIENEYIVLKSSDNQSNFIDIIEEEEKIKDNIIINNSLYGLENIEQKNEMLLNIEDVFVRNIGNKEFYNDFCDKIIKARGVKKTLYEFKNFSNMVYLTNLMNLENIKDDLLSNQLTKVYFDSYKILDKIICIGEKPVNENTYMCALLIKNKIFKAKK